ncbi:Metallo-dependent phosphatase [Cutaneotrichosporon oleaginosum]|uniref:Metallo-dependent phosphatase n=1 Tax=Cutaneotrichosporon oleaginosum TaxID=879819 RepID=A0A0J0XC89_9TREE|nr:Metallo-dependent phosphatase [Cutaneotrichosporon oleaginosum]KLT38681.1 Metallo-dependent phosphatase [Cutaneotrichosporon oleaginosum]TXT12272.1 hypothetical protein COLE_02682 [Cutaneotrichosporon oleaginosum]
MTYAPRSPNIGGLQPRPRRSRLLSRTTQLLALRFGWVVVVIWYEAGEFFSSLSSCRFPDSKLRQVSGTDPTHVVLVADPHVPHPILSHPENARPWVNSVRQHMEELFMRKSWNVVRRLGRIDAVVFLGDMLDWGRGNLSDQEYEDYYQLFLSIFTLPQDVKTYYIPGNNDIPLARTSRYFSPLARQRYVEHFGAPNQVVNISNHSLVLLDAIGLVEEDYRRYASEVQFGEWDGVRGGVIEFVKKVGQERPPSPILVSHIPLARPESATCGPLSEHGRILKGVGPGYQNLLGSETSRFLLNEIKPDIVFSGDDHDYCEISHGGRIREVTVKSFSSNAGVRRPGLQLLSLVPPQPGEAGIADVPCILPDQLGVYQRVYAPLIILTFIYLFYMNIRAAWSRTHRLSEKSRLHIVEEKLERPVPLTLPSRRSAQHLQTLTMTRERHSGAGLSPGPSAPASPIASPRLGLHDDDDTHSPSLSRRSSYGADLNHADYPTPRRSASGGLLPLPNNTQTPRRVVTLPRMMSASEWASAAKAKDMSVLSLVADQSRGPIHRARSFARWLWRTRHSVIVRSTGDMLGIALPAILVWCLLNAMFAGWLF